MTLRERLLEIAEEMLQAGPFDVTPALWASRLRALAEESERDAHQLQVLRCEVLSVSQALYKWRDIHGSGYSSIDDFATFLEKAAAGYPLAERKQP